MNNKVGRFLSQMSVYSVQPEAWEHNKSKAVLDVEQTGKMSNLAVHIQHYIITLCAQSKWLSCMAQCEQLDVDKKRLLHAFIDFTAATHTGM